MNKKFYKPKSDYIFKKMFSNKEYLKDFLENLLGEEIGDIEILQGVVTNKESRQNKYCIFDVIAKTKNKYIHLEMQQKVEEDFEERLELKDKNYSIFSSRELDNMNNSGINNDIFNNVTQNNNHQDSTSINNIFKEIKKDEIEIIWFENEKGMLQKDEFLGENKKVLDK